MPYSTREVSNLVSNNRKTLESSVANLKNLFLVGLASVIVGCTAAGDYAARRIVVGGVQTAVEQSIASEIYRQEMERLQPIARVSQPSLSPEESAILEQYKRTPRVVYEGNYEGGEKWTYYDGKGGKFFSGYGWKNEQEYLLNKDKPISQQNFVYKDVTGKIFPLPKDILKVYYEDPKMTK